MHMIGKILNWDTFFPSSIHAHVGSFIILIVGNIHICNKCLSWFSIFLFDIENENMRKLDELQKMTTL